ncbi:hypothetical protein SLS53_007588 [Cytospora paraplurivora]|uniref:Uncharacterized protein n=1 Tax=Cytospora paraplurivora TaxID=2898453 RepID=A0AAN9U2L3_9PEZI
MESDNSNNYAPRGRSPSAVDSHQSATQQSQPPEAALEKTPTTDTSTVVSKPTSPVPEADRPQTAADVAIHDQDKPKAFPYDGDAKTDIKRAVNETAQEHAQGDSKELARYSAQTSVPEDDDINDDNLSPPPESLSSLSSRDGTTNGVQPGAVEDPEDEIVVGSVKAKILSEATKPAATVPKEKNTAPNTTPIELERRPKRKRAAVFSDLTEDKMTKSVKADESDDDASPAPGLAVATRSYKSSRGLASNHRSVVLGYWRESQAPDGLKHLVKGFIDSRDRLRTRIQPFNREGKIVTEHYPLNPGPGGSWVTFDKIVFDSHLVNLDQTQVKEYVKIRADMSETETEQDTTANDTAAVQQAIKRCRDRFPQAEGNQPPQIAYGADQPEHAVNRPEKRRRTGGSNVAGAVSTAPATPVSQLSELHGTRPTKILLGYWKKSSEPELVDKHAVFGILGNNDMFRVKVGRESRDGRPVQGNFPAGAGALWIPYDDFEPEVFLKDLTRSEIKEYCRVRQYQIDQGEKPEQRRENEGKAVTEARRRIKLGWTRPEPREPVANSFNSAGDDSPYTDAVLQTDTPAHDTRHGQARRLGPALAPSPARASTQPPEFRAANRSNGVEARVERTNSLARNAVARAEAVQSRNEHRDASYAINQAANGLNGQSSFHENVSRLNSIWASQEARRMRAGDEDAKIHLGIKYERKQTGPFQGKLVSQGTILSIDGEDYVEYRVLTKPTF